jgi:iron complex outermembrane receptor protein
LIACCASPALMHASASQKQPLGQQLKSLSLEQLGNVEVVTETKEPTEVWNTPSAIYVLTGDDIRRSGVTSIPDALRLVPGVDVARVNGDRNWSVAIRGLGDQYSKYVLVLIDGRSVYSPLFGGVFWTIDNVMLEDIDRIEIIRGPGGTIWGTDAVNGIINIITKSAAETQGTLASSGGGNVDQNTEDLRYGTSRGKLHIRADAFGFVRSPEFHQDGQPAYDGSRLAQIGFRADLDSGHDQVTFQGDAYLGKLGDAQQLSTFIPPTTYLSYLPTDVYGGNLLGRWRHQSSHDGDLYLQAFWSHDHRIGSNFGETRDIFDIDFLQRIPQTRFQQFTYGFGARVSPSSIQQTVPVDSFNPASLTQQVYSGFLDENLRPLPGKLAINGGLKIEWNNYTHWEFQPNGRILFTPTPHSTLWLAVSRAVRIPDRVDEDIDDNVYVPGAPVPVYGQILGNPHMAAERLLAYEGGFRALVSQHAFFDIAAFHNVYHDLIAQGSLYPGTATTPPYPTGTFLLNLNYQNGINGSTDGFELGPEWDPLKQWKLKSAFSYLHVNLADQPGFTDTTTLTTLHGSSPNTEITLRSLVNLPAHLEFDQTFRFVSALPAQTVPAYKTADARFGRHVAHGFDISVTGENLLQPHHAEYGVSPGPNVLIKRSVYAKLVWTK